jgi:PTH1 family peptidyl-tRNA hydrolase
MYLVAGLGNIGKKYQFNRHNAGFLALDQIHDTLTNPFKKKKNFHYARSTMKGNEVVLIKPATYMNLSGTAITSAMAFFKIPKENIIVIYDDVALPIGKIRIREKGSDGGHNGLKNIQGQLGTSNYIRIRIGVGAPDFPGQMIDHVLGDFSESNMKLLTSSIIPVVKEALECIIQGDVKGAMNRYNGFTIETGHDKSNSSS